MINKTLYNKDYNVEFYHITKNGMTAIINSLPLVWTDIQLLPEDRKIFTMIRNPLKRFLSGYIEVKKLYGMGNKEHTFRKLPPNVEDDIFRKSKLPESFELYISEIERNGFFDSHNLPQYTFLEGYTVPDLFLIPRKIKNVTNFLRFEEMNDQISTLVGDEVVIEKFNVGNVTVKEALSPLLEKYKDKIELLYPEDFKLYNQIN